MNAAEKVDLMPDLGAARQIFAALDQVHLVAIDPEKRDDPIGRDFGCDVESAIGWASRANAAGRNVYWTVNRIRPGVNKKPAKADVIAARFAHVDVDPPKDGRAWSKPQALDALREHRPPPSFIVDSGNGLQAFWRLDGDCENLASAEAVNDQLRHHFDADACRNIDRLMRVPGFVNYPDAKKRAHGREPRLAGWAEVDDGACYELEELRTSLPPVPAADSRATAEPSNDAGAEWRLLTPDDLGLGPRDGLRSAIEHPPGRDRSGDGLAVARLMANSKFPDDAILGILLNPVNAVSAHYLDQRDPRRAALRTVEFVRRPSGSSTHLREGFDPISGDTIEPPAEPEPLPTLYLVELGKVPAKAKAFVIPRLTPAGEVTLFTGPGSAGKSLLAQQLATAAAAGRETLGFQIERVPSIYVTCEDDAEQLHWRQEHLSAALSAPMSELAGRLHLASLRGHLGSELATFAQDGTLRLTNSYKRLVATLQATGARIAFLDNVAHLFTGNENDRGEVTRFVNLLNRLAGETGAAIVLLGHPNKAGDSYSGSTAWLNAVRSQFTIEHDLETDARTLTIGKANYARKGDQVRFFWQDWAFVGEDELPPDRAREFMETKQAIADNGVFLACLAEMTRQQRAVSDKPNAANYAPKAFARMAESKGIGVPRLTKALDRLFRLDRIERAELWKGPDRKAVYGLREGFADGDAK